MGEARLEVVFDEGYEERFTQACLRQLEKRERRKAAFPAAQEEAGRDPDAGAGEGA